MHISRRKEDRRRLLELKGVKGQEVVVREVRGRLRGYRAPRGECLYRPRAEYEYEYKKDFLLFQSEPVMAKMVVGRGLDQRGWQFKYLPEGLRENRCNQAPCP